MNKVDSALQKLYEASIELKTDLLELEQNKTKEGQVLVNAMIDTLQSHITGIYKVSR